MPNTITCILECECLSISFYYLIFTQFNHFAEGVTAKLEYEANVHFNPPLTHTPEGIFKKFNHWFTFFDMRHQYPITCQYYCNHLLVMVS